MREMQIRADFKKTFDLVANGSDLSYRLKFSLGEDDLANLAKLHRDEPDYRQKIFDLLEDCNFHSENAALEGGLYAELSIIPGWIIEIFLWICSMPDA